MFSENQTVYDFTELEKAPEVPGIYGWYVQLLSGGEHDEYHEVFKQKTLSTLADWHLGEEYEGDLSSRSFDFNSATLQNRDLLNSATCLFAPPIYIGIAKSLKSRLRQHMRTINKVFRGGKVYPEDEDEKDDLNIFANRVGEALRTRKSLSINSLYVRAIELQENCERKEIEEVEHFLNRTFVPLYGRK